MKRIALSMMTIAAVAILATSATSAYFSDTKAVLGNTFSTGKVTLGDVSPMKIEVTNLIPGISQTKKISFQYTGTTPADVYTGNTGNSWTPAFYLADKLNVKVTAFNDSQVVYYNGPASGMVSAWKKIATNISAGWYEYNVTYTLSTSADSSYQGQSNANTVVLLHAVQTGGPVPTPAPLTYTY